MIPYADLPADEARSLLAKRDDEIVTLRRELADAMETLRLAKADIETGQIAQRNLREMSDRFAAREMQQEMEL